MLAHYPPFELVIFYKIVLCRERRKQNTVVLHGANRIPLFYIAQTLTWVSSVADIGVEQREI
jgi:hypothetical protein